MTPRISLPALFALFLRFGALAWGGPIAQLGMLRSELVDRRGWTTREHFARALAVYQALPGPEAHEMCCWFGHQVRGRVGAVIAGLGFMLPVSTPCNAIVYSSGRIPLSKLMAYGFMLDVVGVKPERVGDSTGKIQHLSEL